MNDSTTENKKSFRSELAGVLDRHPWWYLLFFFFYMVGCGHLAFDLIFYFFPSQDTFPRWEIYGMALFTSAGTVWWQTTFNRQKLTPEQRQAEKQITRQADLILRQAQDDAKGIAAAGR